MLADVTFVDDACFSFEDDNPVSLVNSASTLLQIVDETCEARGLPVNMNDGKTEFSIELTGVGARKQFKRQGRHIASPRRPVQVRELCHATNMLARSEP